MSQQTSTGRAMHDTLTELTKHYHAQIHTLDAQIAELQGQRAIIQAIAVTELKRSPELKEAAGEHHESLVQALTTALNK